jgi:polyhydroxyalkanoate synthesis regulator phasin
MKKLKLITVIIALIATIGMNAQTKQEKKAQKLADEMTKVMELSEAESKAVYEVQLARFNANNAIETEFANDPEAKKEKLKELGKKTYGDMKKAVGQEKLKIWKDYQENK